MDAKPESSLTGGFLHCHFKKTVLMVVLSLFSQHSFAAICDDFNALADVGIIGQTGFDYGNNSTINGNTITGNGNTPTPLGTSTTVNLAFPPLVPAVFPATGGPDLKPPSPPSVNAGSYGVIEFDSSDANPALIFTGGNYYIEELILKTSSTVRFAPGNYFIEKVSFGNNAQLIVSPSGPVRINIRNSMQVGNESNINTNGATGDLIFNLYSSADFQLGNGNNGDTDVDFNGIIYSPFANTDIDFGNNNQITGAILSAGEVDVGNNTQFDYSASVQEEVIAALDCNVTVNPYAWYQMDSTGWSGVAGEVIDAQGNLNGQAVNGATTGGTNPAIAGNPGTCRYGAFDGINDYIDLSGMPNLTGSFTISAWIYANETGKDQRIFADDVNNTGGYALSLGDGGNGRLRFFSRNVNPVSVDTQNAVITAGQWYHVAAVHNASAKTRKIFINGTAVTLNTGSTFSTYTGNWGVDNGISSIGGETNGAGSEATTRWRFNGNIDEVQIFNSVLSATQINVVKNQTRPCAVNEVHHYAISHTGPGVTCEAQEVIITAHNASHVPVAPSSTTTIKLTTSVVNDGWALLSGNGIFTGPNEYTFNGVETSVKFWLKKTTAASLDINVTDNNTVSDPDDGGTEDRILEFRDTGLRFYADLLPDGSYSLIGNQIAGKPSSVAPGNQSLTLRAVQTNTDTGACEARLKNTTHTVQMATQCIDPGVCKCIDLTSCTYASAVLSISNAGGISKAIDVNGEPVVLTFDNSGYASLSLNYQDAGRIALQASLSLAAIAPNPAISLTGTSNSFVVRPFGFDIDSGLQRANDWLNGALDGTGPSGVVNTSWAQDVSGSRFVKAGDSFNITLRSVLWSAGDDLDNNGVPDLGANLTDNGLTPNFGEETATELVVISHAKKLPSGAGTVNGSLSGGLNINFSGGDGSVSSSISWNEVGIIDLIANLNSGSYLASGSTVTSTQQNFGRFYPAQFALAGGSVTNRIALGGGSIFTYMDEDFGLNYTLTAQNSSGLPTSNYTGVFALLNSPAELNYAAVDTTVPLNLTTSPARLTTGIPVMDWAGGVLNVTDTARISRNASADGPYLVDLGLAPADEDGVTLAGYDLDVDGTPPNDHALIATTQIRFGRIALSNTFGSELQALRMPLNAEYFNGTNFVQNFDDSLTPLTTVGFVLSSEVELGETDGDIQVVTGKTSQLTFNNPLLAGNGGLSFCPPGNPVCTPEPGNAGFIDVRLDLSTLPYLQFDWDGNGIIEDPMARATFGIFSGNSKQIYYRQIFQ